MTENYQIPNGFKMTEPRLSPQVMKVMVKKWKKQMEFIELRVYRVERLRDEYYE